MYSSPDQEDITILDFKPSPCSECCMLSSGQFLHLSVYEDGTECTETSEYKIRTPRSYPEESIQQKYY